MKVFQVMLVLSLVSCGVIEKNCGKSIKDTCNDVFGHDYDDHTQKNSDDIYTLQDKINNMEDVLDAHEIRISMLESISQLHGTLISLNTYAVNNILIPRLSDLEVRLYDLEVDVNQSLSQVQSELLDINTRLNGIEETIKQNDEYVNIPGCEHSYFVLYSANKNIIDFYVTENDGTVNGAWQLQNNTTYSLVIDSQVMCTGVKLNKSQKKFYFNNGSSQVIDLSY